MGVDLLQESKGVSVSIESMCLFFTTSVVEIRVNQIVAASTSMYEPGMFQSYRALERRILGDGMAITWEHHDDRKQRQA